LRPELIDGGNFRFDLRDVCCAAEVIAGGRQSDGRVVPFGGCDLAAQAKSATAPGVPTCNTGSIDATGTTVSFTKAAGTTWVWFQLLVGCGCS
jgi:hypothetical protein